MVNKTYLSSNLYDSSDCSESSDGSDRSDFYVCSQKNFFQQKKTQKNVTKKSQKISKSQIVIKLKNQNCDETQNFKL